MNIDIIDDNNEQARPIYTKKNYESNFPVAKQSKVQFTQLYNCLIEYNMLNYD